MAKRGSRMFSGSPLLKGDNNIPGIKIHKEVKEVLPKIEAACQEMGLDYYPIIVEFVSYDEMSELASYGGFPVRYPHWSFGMEYEEMSRGYEHNQYRISEMVINSNPCRIYCMDSNTLVNNINVIAHAIGHNDFFKNNIFFSHTNTDSVNKLANHGTRIRKYMERWGDEVVTEFIDHCMRVQTLIDPAEAWTKREINKPVIKDERTYYYPDRIRTKNGYMDEWVNNPKYIEDQRKKIAEKETADFLDLFQGEDKNIFGYLKDHAPLKPWQQDIIAMLYEEAMYFSPQGATKMINEGWASYVDMYIMCRKTLVELGGKVEGGGIWEYAEHKMHVLGGKYSMNPYKMGLELLLDIEDRWNKGKFGSEWDDCKDIREKESWDKKLGLGKEKVFEVRKHYNDFLLVNEFFTKEFCEEKEFFEWKKFPNGEYKIVDRDFRSIKKKLIKRHLNRGLPDIRLADPNHLGKGWFLMQHHWDGTALDHDNVLETTKSLYSLWNNPVVLATRDQNEEEVVYVCSGPNVIDYVTMAEYEKEYL